MLDTRLIALLKEEYESLIQGGNLLSTEKLNECYNLFRQKFGPDVLSKLEGEELLQFMHGRPSKDSLVYWLEFNAEFRDFGSIAGGSALKYGIYWRQEAKAWMTGSSKEQKQITLDQAIEITTKQRDQLLEATKLIEALPDNASDEEYAVLQRQMDERCSDTSKYAWGHKYLHLLFPDKIDDYHREDFQRFYLITLFQTPPELRGLYACAGRYVEIAKELGMPINHLSAVLNQRIPKPRCYWRIGTRLGEGNNARSIWDLMRDGNVIAMGWSELGNLEDIPEDHDLRDTVRKALEQTYEKDARVASRKAGEIRNFVDGVSENDYVLAGDGRKVLGIGRVIGFYRFDSTSEPEAPHRRNVAWISFEEWEMPETEGLRTTVVEIKDPTNLIEVERRATFPTPAEPQSTANMPPILEESIYSLPINMILYGPPGTGKTYRLRNEYMEKYFTDRQAVLSPEELASSLVKDMAWWEVIALALLDTAGNQGSVAQILEHRLVQARLKLSANNNPRAMLWAALQTHTKKQCLNVNYTARIEPLLFSKDETSVWSIDTALAEVESPELMEALRRYHNPLEKIPEIRRYKFTTFHQSFSYEDFIEGIKPQTDGGQISYEVRDGIFKTTCQEAAANPDKRYALFIDEINRGNVAGIFGELITLIEDDKRIGAANELFAELPYSRQTFGVPNNLHIIGTMNTADRSVEALDTALRRRFTFKEMRPDPSLILQPPGLGVDLRQLLVVINSRIEQLLDHDHCIGHYYFMSVTDLVSLQTVFKNKILPLLREYFYGNPSKVGMVLGERFVVRSTTATPFASGSWGVDDLDQKEVFAFVDIDQLTEGDFQTIYAQANPGF